VADKVREQFGETRFAALQEAIGRAPGGVAKGFYREDATTKTEREKLTVCSSKPFVDHCELYFYPARVGSHRDSLISLGGFDRSSSCSRDHWRVFVCL